MTVLALAFLFAFVLALSLTPLSIRVAWATGFLDHPEARKLHTSATALLGGLVVFVCGLLAWLLAVEVAHLRPVLPPHLMLVGAVIALATGMWDDRFGMNPFVKLLAQGAAAATLVVAGLAPTLGLPGPVGAIVTLVALVALMNAVNFLDNMNGMVGGLAAIALAAFAWNSARQGAIALSAGQLALAAACLGFLRYNFPRARLFLGDAGSLLLGYSLGASALLAMHSAPAGWGRVGPVLVLGYPVFDMIFVVVTRLREGRKIHEGGKDHTNHRLASVIRCQKRTVMLIWVVGAALSVSGLVVLKLNQALPALLLSGLWTATFFLLGLKLSSVAVVRPLPREVRDPAVASPRPRT